QIVGPEFEVGKVGEEVDTLGGYLVMQIGRVPVRGELVPGPAGFEIEVLDADPRRVKRVKIYRGKDRSSRRDRTAQRRGGQPEPETPSGPPRADPQGGAPGGGGVPPPPDATS